VSLREFVRRFRTWRGNVFVVPFPDLLCELLHKELPWATIVPVPRLWNVLAAAFIDCHTGLATA